MKMVRELNTPDEIFRRLVFVFFLVSWVVAFVLGMIGVVQANRYYILISLVLIVLGIWLKRFGEHRLEFKRLSRSFPYGAPEDDLPQEMRQNLDRIFSELAQRNIGWERRHELRRKLTFLIAQEPLVVQIYREKISTTFPSLVQQHEPPKP